MKTLNNNQQLFASKKISHILRFLGEGLFLACLISGLWTAEARGGSSGGGGYGEDTSLERLLDRVENEGSSLIDPSKFSAYQEIIAPMLKQLKQKAPGLANHLEQITQLKEWYLEDKQLNCKKTVTTTKHNNLGVLACQNAVDVRLNADAVRRADELPKKQAKEALAWLLTHELVRGVREERIAYCAGKVLKERCEVEIRALTRRLMDLSLKKASFGYG